MLAVVAFTWLAYFFNYFAGGPDFGARYWFLMIVPFVALTARGTLTFGMPLGLTPGANDEASAGTSTSNALSQTRWLTAVALAVVGGTFVFMPWRTVDKYWHYRGMRPDIVHLAAEQKFGDGLVMITGREYPDYASAGAFNSLDLSDRVPVYVARIRPSTDSLTIAAFPDRAVWLVDGPTISRAGYVVVAGPLSTADALQRIATPPAQPVRRPALLQP